MKEMIPFNSYAGEVVSQTTEPQLLLQSISSRDFFDSRQTGRGNRLPHAAALFVGKRD